MHHNNCFVVKYSTVLTVFHDDVNSPHNEKYFSSSTFDKGIASRNRNKTGREIRQNDPIS